MTKQELIKEYQERKQLAEEIYSRPYTREERELYPHLLACKVGMYEKFIEDLEKLSEVKE